MKTARRKARPKLQLHQGPQDATKEAASTPLAAETVWYGFTVQTSALGSVTRVVLLQGDPELPFHKRGGTATMEVAHGYYPEEDTRALIDDLLAVLEAHAQKHWERELATRAFLRRAHLEVMS